VPNLLLATFIGPTFLLVGGPLTAALAVAIVAPPVIGLLRISSAA